MKISFHYSPPDNAFASRLQESCDALGIKLHVIRAPEISYGDFYHYVPNIGYVEDGDLIDLIHLVRDHDVAVLIDEWDNASTQQHKLINRVLREVRPPRVVCRLVHGRLPNFAHNLEDVLS
jgi:hypothetical protein